MFGWQTSLLSEIGMGCWCQFVLASGSVCGTTRMFAMMFVLMSGIAFGIAMGCWSWIVVGAREQTWRRGGPGGAGEGLERGERAV